MHACVRHAWAELGSPVSSTSSLLQCFSVPITPIQADKLLAGQFGCFGCLSTSSPEELQYIYWLPRHSLIRTQMISTNFVDDLCHFAKFADIFKDDEPGNVSTVRAIFVQTDC